MYSPSYNGGLTNHLPMMKEAMRRLGIDDTRINELETEYVKRLELAEDSEFGRKFLELRENFYDVNLKEYLSDKLDSIPSALFHHFIRLFYSLNDKDEMRSALAYFELVHQSYPIDGEESKDLFNDLNDLIRRRVHSPINYTSRSTMDKFRTLSNTQLIEHIKVPDEVNIKEIVDILLYAYSITRDFYILHVITGFQALLGLKEFLDIEEAVKKYYMYAQVFIILGDTYLKPLPKADRELEYYVTLAPTLDDAHELKLLYSLTELRKYTDSHLINDIAKYITKG